MSHDANLARLKANLIALLDQREMAQQEDDPNKYCMWCGDDVAPRRWGLGYRTCLRCGETEARRERAGWCIAPIHKSSYILITDKDDLKGINNKGGLVRA